MICLNFRKKIIQPVTGTVENGKDVQLTKYKLMQHNIFCIYIAFGLQIWRIIRFENNVVARMVVMQEV